MVTLGDLPQVKEVIEFEATGEPIIVPWAGTAEPKASDLVVRLPLDKVTVYELPPQVTYLVEGEFKPKMPFGDVAGPKIFGETNIIRDDAMRVIADSAIAPSFVQLDGNCWYQIQLKTPEKPGLYHVKVKSFPPGAVDGEPFGTSEFPFSIRVVELRPAPKP